MKRIVIIGGGFAGFEAAAQLQDGLKGRAKAKVVLINDGPFFTYSPLLIEVVTGRVSARCVRVRLASQFSDVSVVEDRIEGIDLKRMKVYGRHDKIPFDYLLLATGRSQMPLRSPLPHGLLLRNCSDALEVKKRLVDALRLASQAKAPSRQLSKAMTFVVVGGGWRGVELAVELVQAMRRFLLPRMAYDKRKHFHICLIEKHEELLSSCPPHWRQRARRVLSRLGVGVHFDEVVDSDAQSVVLASGRTIASDTFIWAAGTTVPSWILDSGLPISNNHSAIRVDESLQVEGIGDVFAAGSCAEVAGSARKGRHGRVSARQGRIAAQNIMRDLVGSSHEHFYRTALDEVLMLGRLEAVLGPHDSLLTPWTGRALLRFSHWGHAPGALRRSALCTDWAIRAIRGSQLSHIPL